MQFFSNYLSHTERVDVWYNATLYFKFNKLISAQVGVDLMYDHDQIQKLQMKQTLGIGIAYNFGLEDSEKVSSKKIIKPFVTN